MNCFPYHGMARGHIAMLQLLWEAILQDWGPQPSPRRQAEGREAQLPGVDFFPYYSYGNNVGKINCLNVSMQREHLSLYGEDILTKNTSVR